MSNNFPTALNAYTGSETLSAAGHASAHNALEAKVGVDSSAVTTSHDYKLSGVTGSDKAVSKTGAETLTNKTLTTPIISTISNTGTVTFPTATDTLVGRATTDTLTNKTITATSNNIMAKSIASATTTVDVSAATAPTTGQVLTATDSTHATWQTSTSTISLETITLIPVSSKANTNWNTYTVTTTAFLNLITVSGGNQNDEISWSIYLAAGTWKFAMFHHKNNDRGIYSVQLDTVEQGTIDGYNAGAAGAQSEITGIVVAASGVKSLKLKMATKNASSSQYYGAVSAILFIKTA